MKTLALLCAFSLFGANAPLQVIVTTPDLADIMQRIGGEQVEVQLLVPHGADPHKVMPRASMLLKLKRADALVSMGLGFEHAFLPALLEKVGRADFGRGDSNISQGGSAHLTGSDFIGTPLEIPAQLNRGAGVEVHPLGNPHWNTNPVLMRKFAVGARDFLIKQRPDAADIFQKNWQQWDDEAQRLIEHWQQWMLPAKGISMVTYHRSWSYFADAYGIKILGEIEPKPGMSPTTKHLASLAKEMQSQNTSLLLIEPWYPESKLGNLPRVTGAAIVKRASTSGADGYLQWMNDLISDVAAVWGLAEPKIKDAE